MSKKRRTLNITLTLLIMVLGGTAVWIGWLSPLSRISPDRKKSFGVYENRQLVEITGMAGRRSYVVEDASGNFLFNIPLKNVVIDCRFRGGKLRFRYRESGKEGHIDSSGYMGIADEVARDMVTTLRLSSDTVAPEPVAKTSPRIVTSGFEDADIASMTGRHPFGVEARKVLSGRLPVSDSIRRRKILSYCEHFRSAYTTKDIDFLRQVFSENALIIVGNTVKSGGSTDAGYMTQDMVRYDVRSKEVYLKRLLEVFRSNRRIDVAFSGFKIMRHPTLDGIYGVSLRQEYRSDSYSDDGYLFLLWDFRNESMPLIHVRTWQTEESIAGGDDIIDIGDFNLE